MTVGYLPSKRVATYREWNSRFLSRWKTASFLWGVSGCHRSL